MVADSFITLPQQVDMFPSSWRELFFGEPVPAIPLEQQLLKQGEVFQLAQPWWPSASVSPSLIVMILMLLTAFIQFVAFERETAIVNRHLRNILRVAGDPAMGFFLGLLATEIGLVGYENDIRRRTGYYDDSSDPRWIISISTILSMVVFIWASRTLRLPATQPSESTQEATQTGKEAKKSK